MEERTYKTDKLTVLSYGLLVVAYFLFFFLIVERRGGFSLELFVLFVLILPILGYFLFLLRKRVFINSQGIGVVGLTGRKFFKWSEIKEISLSTGRKGFLFITNKNGELILIDDSVSGFSEIATILKRKVPNAVSSNFGMELSNYKKSRSSIYLILVAAFVLIFLLIRNLTVVK